MPAASLRGRPEQRLQTRIVNRLRRDFECRVCHVANGGTRGRVEAIRLKEAGVEAGHPDLVVYGEDRRFFLIEVKDEVAARERAVAPTERFDSLSASQKTFVPDLRRFGFQVYVVDSLEDAVAAAVAAGLGPRRTAPFLTRDAGGF